MDIPEDHYWEMQMHLVRLCRTCKTGNQVWSGMKDAFPEYTILQIQSACRGTVKKLLEVATS